MRKIIILLILFFSFTFFARAQKDTATDQLKGNPLQAMVNEVKSYKIDTSAVPDDKITRKIIELRNLRGSFNINEVITYKIGEEERNKETPAATLFYLKEQFKNGKGKRWIDNATIWIYRSEFNYKELKQLVRFYKTNAGQKLAHRFPIIMLKTLMTAQIVHDQLVAEKKAKTN